jgi:hypothetical protein
MEDTAMGWLTDDRTVWLPTPSCGYSDKGDEEW